jgi:hypothetical protein
MNNEKTADINAASDMILLPAQEDERPMLVKKIGETAYRVTIHFNATSSETMSDKIKRMLRNEINRM